MIRLALFLVIFSSAPAPAGQPRRVSIAPGNDLSAVPFKPPAGSGVGIAICGAAGLTPVSDSYRDGRQIGHLNDHFDHRSILAIDDGNTVHPATDPETGFPVIVLTDARPTRQLLDLVTGYNDAMRFAHRHRG